MDLAYATIFNVGGVDYLLRDATSGNFEDYINSAVDLIENNYFSINPTMTTGSAVNISDGTTASIASTQWASSEYVYLPAGTVRVITNAVSPSQIYGYALYNKSKTFISGGLLGSSTEIVPTTNVRYIRITSYAESHSGIYVRAYADDELSFLSSGGSTTSNLPYTTEGAINSNTGAVSSFSGYEYWAYTDYIRIPKGTAAIKTDAQCSANGFGLAFYDGNKNFISGSGLDNYSSPTVIINSNYKYIRLSDSQNPKVAISITFLAKSEVYAYESSTFAAAVATGKMLRGTYTLNSTMTIPEGRNVVGDQCTVNVGSSGKIIMKNGSSISGIRFVGDWTPSRTAGDGTTYTEYGYVPILTYENLAQGDTDALFGTGKTYSDAVIYIDPANAFNTTVKECRFENIDRLAVFAGGQRHQEKTNPIICNNYFVDCRQGVYVHGEFVRCYANEYLRCLVGCYISGGNSNNSSEIFKCCDCGYYMPDNATAHNLISTSEAAHCGLAGLYIVELASALGCQVTGCEFADAPVVGADVNNLVITSSRLDTWIEYTSGSKNSILCCNVGKSYLYSKTGIYSVPVDTLISLNRGLGTTTDAEANNE